MRAKGNRNCAVLLFLLGWVFLLHCLSIFLFTKGFLLRRTVVFNSSRCSDEWVAIDVTDARITNSASNRTRCWMERRYNKLVIIVIDALRVDFGLFDPLLSISDTPHYRNKLPIIHELLVSPPEKNDAHIFRFIADPPTTTMQRIKGLTTGSLPTFIDAGDNFASNALAEDNWVTSARDNGFGLVMLGDDTWLSLYPHHFTREFGYNPFDVKDLHTVDNGILKNLFSELKKPDWSILVAHFEGVDHVGHRFGPNHPEMAAKLSQMDNVIRNVVDTLDNSTLLVVMGDHGMTPSGDHGGESVQETNALLFMYSKQQRLYPESMGLRSVSQTDLVPTVSLLLGLPIPFSNLGHVIPELFFYGKNPNHTLLRAMHLNACQLSQYLDTYNKVSGDLPSQEFYQLDIEFHLIKKDFWLFMSNTGSVDFEQLQTLYLKYFQQVQAMCRSVWAKFDLVLMWLGIFMLVISLLPVLVLVFQVRSNSTIQLQYYNRIWIYIMCGAVFGSIFGIPLHYLASSKSSDSLLMFCCFGSSLGSVIAYLWFECRSVLMKFAASSDRKLLRDQFPDIDDLFATVIVFIQCFGLLSNSYVLYEDSCISFFLVSLYVVCLVAKASQLAKFQSVGSNANIGRKSLYFHSASVFSLAIVIAAICSQTATHFQGCVELKIGCKPSSFLLSLSAAEHLIGSMKTARYAISCICVALVPATVWFLLKRQGQLENFSPFHLSASCGLPAIVVCIWIYWALMALPAESLDQLPDWQHVIMPRIVYVIAIVIVVVVLLRPVAAKARICGFLPHLRPQSKSTVMELSGWESLYVSPALLLWVTVWLILTLLQVLGGRKKKE
ncbi:GPI ethanolamine phosphate transferase 3-like isoform X2 [Corticium candelabrum]|uniref:GPI ethanolamine phosphate transferase 3-like isoform X2 n=1 Tax=Corticium candelabrum TaxID=121492 RepID=UPI002E2663E6|nr:GPI ethanolamine phosphate transferase 3-like isoform X2 [Corticium candelabrum]